MSTLCSCPSCGDLLNIGEVMKGRCGSCGELFAEDEVIQNFVDDDEEELVFNCESHWSDR